MNLRIIPLGQNPEYFQQTLELAMSEQWGDSKLSALMWAYYASIETEPFTNFSVACYDGDEPVCLALANNVGGVLGYFGQPISFCYRADKRQITGIEKLLVVALAKIQQDNDIKQLRIAHQNEFQGMLSDWQIALVELMAIFSSSYQAQVDLSLEEDRLWSDTRRRYRSFINFGKREIPLEAMISETLDRSLFDQFQQFHKKIAGRVTRPQESWDEMYNLIKAGRAELLIGRYESNIVSCTYLFYDSVTAIYGTGVYERDLFDKPISHWPLYHAILRARERGNKYFNLGEVFLGKNANKKSRDVAFFKKGFTSRVKMVGQWDIENSNPGEK